MAEKKTATKKVATEKAATAKKATKTTTAKAAVKAEKVEKAPAKKAPAKKAESSLYINAQSVGFRAGDVYQALAAAGKSLTVAEIAKAANITTEEVLLGLGWLFKEGKVVGENVADLRLA